MDCLNKNRVNDDRKSLFFFCYWLLTPLFFHKVLTEDDFKALVWEGGEIDSAMREGIPPPDVRFDSDGKLFSDPTLVAKAKRECTRYLDAMFGELHTSKTLQSCSTSLTGTFSLYR